MRKWERGTRNENIEGIVQIVSLCADRLSLERLE
jgi:hypothetical protein